MRGWLLLGGAIVAEVTGSLSLEAAQDDLAWYGLVAIGYVAAFALLSVVLRTGMPLGVAYGVWSAMGVALTAVLAAVLFDHGLSPVMIGGMALVIAGVLLVELGSREARS